MKWKVYTRERDIVTRGYVVWDKILSVTNYLKCTYKYIVQIFYYLYNKQTGPGLLLFFPWILFQAVQVVSPTLGLPCWSSWSPYDFYSSSLFSFYLHVTLHDHNIYYFIWLVICCLSCSSPSYFIECPSWSRHHHHPCKLGY